MNDECRNCGSIEFVEVFDLYQEEVRKRDPDLDLLGRISPPTQRSIIHGFIMAVLFWILMLAPFFAPEGKMWRTILPIAALALAWVPIFFYARKKDRARLAAYKAQRICTSCGTIES
ncbi:MAG: hypothetical protein IPP78_15985 [Holophagaceae bacterium]|nr:hypothetical protein [Holophagaceae bacterium]